LIQGRLSEVVGHFTKVVDTYERTGDPRGCAGLALVNLARVYQRRAEYDRAWEHLRKGTDILQNAGVRGILIEAWLQRAELELETGQPGTAQRTCRRALREAGALGAKLLEARALRILGRVAMSENRPDEAEAQLRDSAALAQRANSDYEVALALLHLAELYASRPQGGASRSRRAAASAKAAAIFRRLGAPELAAASGLQAAHARPLKPPAT
jgi:tetratricopeptide (TPR) repeat protein